MRQEGRERRGEEKRKKKHNSKRKNIPVKEGKSPTKSRQIY